MIVYQVRLLSDATCASCGADLLTGQTVYWAPAVNLAYCCRAHAQAAGCQVRPESRVKSREVSHLPRVRGLS